jgi:hypothetical protein
MASIGNVTASLGVAGVSASVSTDQGRADSGKLNTDIEECVQALMFSWWIPASWAGQTYFMHCHNRDPLQEHQL